MLTHNALEVTEHTFHLPRLPKSWDGTRIVQLSDLHFYEHTSLEFYRRVTETVNDLAPDIIAVTGDVVHFGTNHTDKARDFLSTLNARYGKFSILGNHDYYDFAHGAILTATMQAAGLTVLKNEAVALIKPESQENLWVAGLDDLWCGAPDIPKTMAPIPDGEFVLMLGHNPLLFDPVAHYTEKPIDMLLSGHTHAGHVYIPPLGPIYRQVFKMKYRYHHYQQEQPTGHKTQLFVSSGVGSAAFYMKKKQKGFPRFRFNTKPEVVLHTLSCAP